MSHHKEALEAFNLLFNDGGPLYCVSLSEDELAACEAISAALTEAAETRQSYDLFHKAQERATRLWRERGGDPMTLPDSAKLMVWCAEQIAATATVPEGWQLVPVDPTPEMIELAGYTLPSGVDCDADIEDVYWTMLRAAPKPPCASPSNDKTGCRSKTAENERQGDMVLVRRADVECFLNALERGYLEFNFSKSRDERVARLREALTGEPRLKLVPENGGDDAPDISPNTMSENAQSEGQITLKALGVDYWHDDEWETTNLACDIEDLAESLEYADAGQIVPVYTLIEGPTVYAIRYVLTRDEDGDPDKAEVRLYSSEMAALAALKGGDA